MQITISDHALSVEIRELDNEMFTLTARDTDTGCSASVIAEWGEYRLFQTLNALATSIVSNLGSQLV